MFGKTFMTLPVSGRQVALTVLLVCAAAAGDIRAADQVTRIHDGVTLRGRLTVLTASKIELERSNGEKETFRPDEVRDVRFDREPSVLQRIRSNIRTEAWETAQESLKKAMAEYSGGDRRVAAEMDYLKARILAGRAEQSQESVSAAVEALQRFRTLHPNHYRSDEATILLAGLLKDSDPDQAATLLETVRQSPSVRFALQAGLLLGQIDLARERYEQAETAFGGVIHDIENGESGEKDSNAARILYTARIGQAACLRHQNRPEDALKQLQQVVADVPEELVDIAARAWLDIGACHQDAGRDKDALLAFLHVDLLYASAKAEHAKALNQLIELWEKTGHPDRARDARTRLEQLHPDSFRARDTAR